MGLNGTIKRVEQFFYWPTLRKDVVAVISQCVNCQRNKPEHVPYPSLLQPLPIPELPWQSVSMDFIEGLPRSDHKDTILVVEDGHTKYAHFIALTHPNTVKEVAVHFFNQIHKLHDLPSDIVSDRDSNLYKSVLASPVQTVWH